MIRSFFRLRELLRSTTLGVVDVDVSLSCCSSTLLPNETRGLPPQASLKGVASLLANRKLMDGATEDGLLVLETVTEGAVQGVTRLVSPRRIVLFTEFSTTWTGRCLVAVTIVAPRPLALSVVANAVVSVGVEMPFALLVKDAILESARLLLFTEAA